jgi:hypothetical protein
MSPIIRIDEEVYSWLQSRAQPFDDTPNSVLRRVAGLDAGQSIAHRQKGAAMPKTQIGQRITGEGLNRRYRLGALHALYHKDGTFFERLVRFPGVLCDPKGYVRFESAAQFERDPRVAIGEKVNVRQGLSSHPRYQRFPE